MGEVVRIRRTIGASAASQVSSHTPRQPGVMRPSRLTAVASTHSIAAPEPASVSRWA